MAILEIKVKDKIFESHNDVQVEKCTPYYIEGNGWKCKIYRDGNISCSATNIYFGVEHQLIFTIKDGWAKIRLRIGNLQEKIIKCYKLEEWPADGVIRLSDGFVDKRRAVFRDSAFQNFISEYGITSLRYDCSDAVYKVIQEVCEGVTRFQESVETDGDKKLIYEEVKCLDEKVFTVIRLVEITNSTWTIKTARKSNNVVSRVLYTTEKLQETLGLPKLK